MAELLVPGVFGVAVALIALVAQWGVLGRNPRESALEEIELIERLRKEGLTDSADRVVKVLAARTQTWEHSTELWFTFLLLPGIRILQVGAVVLGTGVVLVKAIEVLSLPRGFSIAAVLTGRLCDALMCVGLGSWWLEWSRHL